MVRNLVRKGGVPALAYPSTDASTPWPCTLILLRSETTQFTVLLEASISIHGVDGKQGFALRFDGHNLLPGKISLEHIDIPLLDEWVNSIARKGQQPALRMLSLTLKAPCSVWYPSTFGGAVSRFDTPSQEIVTLAKTTGIRILFDTKWLGGNLSQLRSVSQVSSQLSGVPVLPGTIYTSLYLQTDRSILNYVEDAKPEGPPLAEGAAPDVMPSVEDAEAEAPPIEYAVDAPPSYAHASSKRSMYCESSSRTQHRHIANAHPQILPA
jgi:hypothetical protein